MPAVMPPLQTVQVPGDWAAIVEETAPGILQQTDRIAVPGEDWVSAATRALSTVAMADYQRRLLNVQLDRARQGLAPLNAQAYGLGVNVGLSPQVLLLGAAALAVLFFAMRRR
jgi:hypothetical protein